MSVSTLFNLRVSKYAINASLAALALTACGPRSILGHDDDPDVSTADTADVTPALDASDAPDATVADVADVPDVTRVDAVDAMDAMDVPDTIDVIPDVPDAMVDDVPLRPGILGSAAEFTILAGSTVSNTGLTTIVGEVGVDPGTALVGIPAGTVVHAGDPVAATAEADTTVAYNYLAGLPCGTTLTGQDLGGMTLAPGVYCFSSSAMLNGTLTLDGQGQPDPLFVFQIGSTLVTANNASILTINGAQPCDLYWQTGSSATIGIGSNFAGNVIALGSVTLTSGVSLNGRALARTGGVTMDTNSVSNASCPDPERPMPNDAGDADASDSSTSDAAPGDAGPGDAAGADASTGG